MEELKESLFNVGGGKIGNYKNCSFQTYGENQSLQVLPLDKSIPTIGEIGVQERVEEVKIELVFQKKLKLHC